MHVVLRLFNEVAPKMYSQVLQLTTRAKFQLEQVEPDSSAFEAADIVDANFLHYFLGV